MTARSIRLIRAGLIIATLLLFAGTFLSLPAPWHFAFASVSGALAAYATIMIVTLALAFSRTVGEIGDSDGMGVTFGRVAGLLFAYPLYRAALVLVPLSLMFYYLNRASPGAFFDVPVAENNPFSFMQRTAEALLLQLFPEAAQWRPSAIAVAQNNPWSMWLTIALMGAPIAALVDVARAWLLAIVVVAMRAIQGVKASKTTPNVSSSSATTPVRGDALAPVSRHEQSGARL